MAAMGSDPGYRPGGGGGQGLNINTAEVTDHDEFNWTSLNFSIEFHSVNHPSFPLSFLLLSSLSPPSFFIILPFFPSLPFNAFISSLPLPLSLPLSLPLHQVTAQLADVSQKAFSFLSSTVQVLGEKVSQVQINIVFVYQSLCCIIMCTIFYNMYDFFYNLQ